MSARRKKILTPKKKRTGIMGLITTQKITPFLALFALLFILYYKGSSKPKKKKKKKRSNIIRTVKFKAPDFLGQPRFRGPKLTRSHFAHGAIIIRLNKIGSGKKTQNVLEVGVVQKSPKSIQVFGPYQKHVGVLKWLKRRDGRYALYRLPQKKQFQFHKIYGKLRKLSLLKAPKVEAKKGKGSTSQPAQAKTATQWIRALYRQAGFQLPNEQKISQNEDQQWLKALTDQCDYNDLDL